MIDPRFGSALGPPVALASAPLRPGTGPLAVFALCAGLLLGLAAWGLKGFAPGGFVPATALLADMGALCAVASLVLLARWSPPRRGTLTLYERGFVFTPPAGAEAGLLFDEVESFALRSRPSPRDWRGKTPGVAQRAAIRSASATLRFRHFSAGLQDPVLTVLGTLQEKLTEAAEARLRSGGSLDGSGWSLGPDGLLWRHTEPRVPLAAFASTGIFQRRMSLWRRGEDRAFLSVASDTPNALILRRVVQRALPAGPEPAEPGKLGRILFEVRSKRAPFRAALAALMLAAFCFSFFVASADKPGPLAAEGLACLICLYSLVYDVRRAVRTGRRHEHGLSMSTPWSHREILFADVQKFRYRVYYQSPRTTIEAWPAQGPSVILSKDGSRPDSDLLALRDLLRQGATRR